MLLLPAMTTIADGAFLADDTLVASYELRGGWMRLGARARSASARSSATPGWPRPAARCPSGGLVGGAVVRPAEVEGGLVLARLAAGAAAPRRSSDATRAAPSDPPRRLRVARAAGRAVPASCR